MKVEQKHTHTILCILISLSIGTISKAQTPYTLKDNDVKINKKGYIRSCSFNFDQNPSGTILTIPVVIKGVVVRGIADKKKGVFENKNIHEVRMQWNITYIGANAFRNNPIVDLNLNNLSFLRYIGSCAFYCNEEMSNCILPRLLERNNQQFFISWSDSDGSYLYRHNKWDYRKAFHAKIIPIK